MSMPKDGPSNPEYFEEMGEWKHAWCGLVEEKCMCYEEPFNNHDCKCEECGEFYSCFKMHREREKIITYGVCHNCKNDGWGESEERWHNTAIARGWI